jgi:monofunctional glycosyltransferase
MDRPDETSGLSAAPFSAPRSDQEPNSGIPDVEIAPALLMAPPLPLPAWRIGLNGAAAVAENIRSVEDWQPPRPLPARAFVTAVPAAADTGDEVAFSALITEPALSYEVAVPPLPQLPVAELAGDGAMARVPIDPALSEGNTEASSPSLSPVESAIANALREIKPHQPIEISELRLPDGTAAKDDDLGETVPRRMLEPRLWAPPPPPAFDGLAIDPSMRPELRPLEQQTPGVSTDYGSLIKSGARLLARIVVGWLALVLLLIVAYRFINPPVSALMVQQWLTGQSVAQKWVPMEDISPNVVRAVLLSEDGRFCEHFGIDFEAIEDAIENSDGRSRGGSTISMQVIKNLFLWPSKSYLRKAIELPLTYFMEVVWSKRRIMEVYLNIAEWGPGIFGIGAASDFHFRKSARNLSVREAAQLAVALPNPLARNAGRPGPGLQRLSNAIQVRMRLAPRSQLSCVLANRRF